MTIPRFIVGTYHYTEGKTDTPQIELSIPPFITHTQHPRFLAVAIPKDSGDPRALKIVQLFDEVKTNADQKKLERALTEAEEWWISADEFLFGDADEEDV